jgi:PhnB protein
MPPTKPIPDGFHTVTPHLVVKNGLKAIEFYKKAFAAREISVSPGPGGTIMHATLQIGDSIVMLNDEFPDFGCKGPESIGGTPVTIHLYVDDADKWFDRALATGATETQPIEDAFWGDRYGQVTDPFGHQWSIATRKENLTQQQIEQRAAAAGFAP